MCLRPSPRPFSPGIVWPKHLGREDVLLAREELAQDPARQHLALAAVVDVGGVEERDAAVERATHDRLRILLAERPRPLLVLAEAHHSQAKARDAQACRSRTGRTPQASAYATPPRLRAEASSGCVILALRIPDARISCAVHLSQPYWRRARRILDSIASLLDAIGGQMSTAHRGPPPEGTLERRRDHARAVRGPWLRGRRERSCRLRPARLPGVRVQRREPLHPAAERAG